MSRASTNAAIEQSKVNSEENLMLALRAHKSVVERMARYVRRWLVWDVVDGSRRLSVDVLEDV